MSTAPATRTGAEAAPTAPQRTPRHAPPHVSSDRAFVRRVLIVLLLGGVAAALWMSSHALILLFGAILFAVILRGLAGLLLRLAPRLPDTVAVGIVLVLFLLVIAGCLLLFGAQISEQFGKVAQQLPSGLTQVEQWLRQTEWGHRLLEFSGGGLPLSGGNGPAAGAGDGVMGGGAPDAVGWLVRQAGQALLLVANGLAGLVVVFFGAVFLALQPGLYRSGLEKMVPKDRQAQVDRAMDRSGNALWLCAAGQLFEMIIIGVLTGVGLWLLGVPAPLALGIIAGLLEFIPFAGPILAAIPGVLLALTVSPTLALWTALFYLILQQLEGNVILPLVQRRAVSLPPVMAIFALLVAGALFGAIGVLFAVPMAVAVLTLVQDLYVKDGLHREVHVAGT